MYFCSISSLCLRACQQRTVLSPEDCNGAWSYSFKEEKKQLRVEERGRLAAGRCWGTDLISALFDNCSVFPTVQTAVSGPACQALTGAIISCYIKIVQAQFLFTVVVYDHSTLHPRQGTPLLPALISFPRWVWGDLRGRNHCTFTGDQVHIFRSGPRGEQ